MSTMVLGKQTDIPTAAFRLHDGPLKPRRPAPSRFSGSACRRHEIAVTDRRSTDAQRNAFHRSSYGSAHWPARRLQAAIGFRLQVVLLFPPSWLADGVA